MMNEGIFFNKYERDPIPLKDAYPGEYYGIAYDPEPKVLYIINKYESNPAAADIDDDDDKSDGNAPNVQYVIEQPIEASYMEVYMDYDHNPTTKSFDTSVTFIEMGAASSSDKIVLIPDPSNPTRSTEGHTLHQQKRAEEAKSTTPAIAPVPSVKSVKYATLPPIPVAKASAPVSSALMAKVLFNFAGTGANEMPLTAGETVEVVQRGKPGAWSKGLRGSFPTDYVQFIESADSTAVVAPKKGGRSKTRRKGGQRLMTARKSNSKTRSKRGGAKSKKDTEICAICLEELKKGEQISKLKCKHRFHKSCIEPVCLQKGNIDVHCPLCRGDISFSCAAHITRASPWKYNPYTDPIPFDNTQFWNMTLEKRRQVIAEVQKHHRNWLARNRKTIRNETPAQRAERIETETLLNADMETARDRYFMNISRPRVDDEQFSPHSPDYTPPTSRSPVYNPGTPRSPASP